MSTESTSKGISLLDLPRQIRHLIYYFLGLHRGCPIALAGIPVTPEQYRGSIYVRECIHTDENQRLQHRWPRAESFEPWDCFCSPIPTSVLTVCRSLTLEALTYFYGINRFEFFGCSPSDLDFFYKLPSLALSCMTSLMIQLDNWSHNSEGYESSQMEAWERLCKHLSKHVRPNQLHLTFICDLSFAEQLCQSIAGLPRLRSCNIRLGSSPDHERSSLARATALKHLGRPVVFVPHGTFHFFRLPTEIRLQILQYTHLTPMADTFAPHFDPLNIVNGRIWRPGYRGPDLPQNCCCVRTSTKDLTCCCPSIRAAFSTTCSCRLLPYSLFQVNKQMRLEAEFVMFRSNRFDFRWGMSHAITFFDSLGKRNLWAINHICFFFSRSQIYGWQDETRSEWRSVIKYMKNNLNIQKLCIVIDTRPNIDYPSPEPHSGPDLITPFETHCELALELMILRGLQDLHLKYGRLWKLQKSLEQEVIGDDYDSYQGNRLPKEPKQSWQDANNDLPISLTGRWMEIVSRYRNSGETRTVCEEEKNA